MSQLTAGASSFSLLVWLSNFTLETLSKCFCLCCLDIRNHLLSGISKYLYSSQNWYFPLPVIALSASLCYSSIISFRWVTNEGSSFLLWFTFRFRTKLMDSLALVVNIAGGTPRPVSSRMGFSIPVVMASSLLLQNHSNKPAQQVGLFSSFLFHSTLFSSSLWYNTSSLSTSISPSQW